MVVYHQSLGCTASARSRSYILLIRLLMWYRRTSLWEHTSISLRSTVLFTGRKRFIIIQLPLRTLREDRGRLSAGASSAKAKHSHPMQPDSSRVTYNAVPRTTSGVDRYHDESLRELLIPQQSDDRGRSTVSPNTPYKFIFCCFRFGVQFSFA
jgi:hypothetical protein